jgi:hypothetical protein
MKEYKALYAQNKSLICRKRGKNKLKTSTTLFHFLSACYRDIPEKMANNLLHT